MTQQIRKVKFGNTERNLFGKVTETKDMPYLIEVQKDSFNRFVKEGIRQVFDDFCPITEVNTNHFELSFIDYDLSSKPKYSEQECKDKDLTYSAPLRVTASLTKKESGEVIKQEIYMGEIPLMTNNGSFIINGAERAVVSQLVRSPGVYHKKTLEEKSGKELFETQVIPDRGAWLEFEQGIDGEMNVKVDRKRKVAVSVLLRSLGYGTDEEINKLFDNDEYMRVTCEKDSCKNAVQGMAELYKRLKPGEQPTDDAIRRHIYNMFFDTKRYYLGKVGRYKFNKKLRLVSRLVNQEAYDNIVNPETGKVIVKQGEIISQEKAVEIQNAGINEVDVKVFDGKARIIGNNTATFKSLSGLDEKDFRLLEYVHIPSYRFIEKIAKEKKAGALQLSEDYAEELNEILYIDPITAAQNNNVTKKRRLEFVEAALDFAEYLKGKKIPDTYEAKVKLRTVTHVLNCRHITKEDIISICNYNSLLRYNIGTCDNIDHLGNRRVKAVGELLQHQFRAGMVKLDKQIKDRMATSSKDDISALSLMNSKTIISAINDFFGNSQLSQFMDQTNPISELTHKRKLSALGPGGLNKERATFEVRDVHYSHYGRLCPIETPEGQNIGLISSLSTYARINEFGFIETPYNKVVNGVVSDEIVYMPADEQDNYYIAQANEPLNEKREFVNDRVTCRYREEILLYDKRKVDYMDVSPKQLVSVATALVPFLENDDTNRALMGSNMQRQAVPLIKTETPIVATGIEAKIAYDSGVMVIADVDGIVTKVSSDLIEITNKKESKQYYLKKFARSNQGTCINQKPIVSLGQKIKVGDILADGPSTCEGELALGKNMLIGFMPWEGYNYEDAILISERLVKEDLFTSVHIEEYDIEERNTKAGNEEITNEIPGVNQNEIANLGPDGIIRIGTEVKSNDILVGKITPKGEDNPGPQEKLIRTIFGNASKDVRNTSLTVPNGGGGVVVDVKVFTKDDSVLPTGVNKRVRVYIAQKRKISIGDKMAGRHGNKGVISRILPEADMPYMEDGTPLDIVLNPMGVPSRMNVGQVLEVHLGMIARMNNWKVATPVFDGATESEIKELFLENKLINPDTGRVDGKFKLYDGRTGTPFENRITVGIMYMLKLNHLVDDKIHARSTGTYSLVSQQPLGGKAQLGGQRFGEMEVWALEAYGAANVLQEIITVKSDDVHGRTNVWTAIANGKNSNESGFPESFKVLTKELQSLGLDIKVITGENEPIEIDKVIRSSFLESQYDHREHENKEVVDLSVPSEKTSEKKEESMDSIESMLFSDNEEL